MALPSYPQDHHSGVTLVSIAQWLVDIGLNNADQLTFSSNQTFGNKLFPKSKFISL